MSSSSDIKFMELALQQAEIAEKNNEVPVGAILVYQNQVIGTGYNMMITKNNSTYHAEMVAIQSGCKTLNNYRLLGSSLYVTLEPCLMCSGAILYSRISRLIYGAQDEKNKYTKKIRHIIFDKELNHHMQYEGNVLKQKCEKVLKEFFKKRR